jgi:hypothetical protein
MSPVSSQLTRHRVLQTFAVVGAFGLLLLAVIGSTQTGPAEARTSNSAEPPAKPPVAAASNDVPTAREILGPSFTVPLANQPPAKIVVDPPLHDELAKGVAAIQYRTENLRVLPVFGPAALAVSPRIGHLHVTVDDAPWHWAHTSGQELIVAGLPPGSHKILIELADPNHKVLAQEVTKFEVPRPKQPDPKAGANNPAPNAPKPVPAEQPAAKIIVDPPQPDRLARGVVFIQYRTENLQILPVFGPAALAVSPRIGHLHVTVDDAPWHWADASGGPLIVSDLPPGPHKILIELADANHKALAQELIKFEAPRQ